ncbi:hypothetical protein Srubr_71680 [Streptomyces rubradiris]|uniref:Uncharacterized protein n=1 Tax=Streptomyces rubradiris TaxID=285531 RepID=A0ABQ3RN89_STRRR|nr:hypothetical protein GCM10018792_17380 [Streptomyces rubradiris]GHI57322.1 hypothetical protein Srubr_71680 [Streptomyces rubradiris]
MVSSQMLWQSMQAAMQSCISRVSAGIVGDWVMAPPGKAGARGGPRALPSYARPRHPARRARAPSPVHGPEQEAGQKDERVVVAGRRPEGRLPKTPNPRTATAGCAP